VKTSSWLLAHWGVLVALILFVLLAPVSLFALPLAALLLTTRSNPTRVVVLAVVAGGFGTAWLLHQGELPDQVVRASAVIAVSVFVSATHLTRSWVVHRIMLAVTASATGVAILLYQSGRSWQELHWWVEHRMGYLARLMLRTTWRDTGSGNVEAGAVQELLESSVSFVADFHPAIVTLQLMAGLALATVVYHRLAIRPIGLAPNKFRNFRFTEHLGWAAILALVVVLVPRLAAAKLGAMNVLLVIGTLFGLRGLAVVVSGFQHIGAGCLTAAFSVVVSLLILPAALISMTLIGIVDTRFDLRKRMQKPLTGG